MSLFPKKKWSIPLRTIKVADHKTHVLYPM